MRMSPERLEDLLGMVGPFIQKKTCRSREIISPAERLVVTIQYLASGDSQQSQSFNFWLGRATERRIVKKAYIALWAALNAKYQTAPSNVKE